MVMTWLLIVGIVLAAIGVITDACSEVRVDNNISSQHIPYTKFYKYLKYQSAVKMLIGCSMYCFGLWAGQVIYYNMAIKDYLRGDVKVEYHKTYSDGTLIKTDTIIKRIKE